MENNQNTDLNDLKVNMTDLDLELKRKKEELMDELNTPEMKEINTKSEKEVGEVIGDLFYNSVKAFFDVGFKLAKNLNLEFLTNDHKQEDNKPKKEK